MYNRNTIIHINDQIGPGHDHTGPVLDGILSSGIYQQHIYRDIIISPITNHKKATKDIIDDSYQVLYSSRDNLRKHPYSRNFAEVEEKFGVSIIFGHRNLISHDNQTATGDKTHVEFVLIDVSEAAPSPVNALKAWMYDEFGIESNRYEANKDYDLYVKLAPAALAVTRAMDACHPDNPAIMISHDVSGMPTILAAVLDPLASFKTVLWAHEVPTVSDIIQQYPGHDTMFCNIMQWAKANDYFLSDVFGPQDYSYKHKLFCAARHCDNIIAVSQRVADHIRFLEPQMKYQEIDVAPDGLPCRIITLHQKLQCKINAQQFSQNLLGYCPDHIFTHFANTHTTKGCWRDLRVLYHLEQIFAKQHKTAVLFIIGTENCDSQFRTCIQQFNDRNHKIKILYINQRNYATDSLDTLDIKIASDLEFGQSIYEPFGLAQLQALSFGSLCIPTNVCGCLELINKIFNGTLPANVISANYTALCGQTLGKNSLLHLNQNQRDNIEEAISINIAGQIAKKLPTDHQQLQKLLDIGHKIIEYANWDNIIEKHHLKAIRHTLIKQRNIRQIA
ncbi:MAG: glycosyltransferase [Phycisphaerae bacterium]|nr:glycosyltransferase [Phycisphaerae bacterium]